MDPEKRPQIALDFDPRTPCRLLSVAQMQLVEIAKALSLKANTISTIKKMIFKKLGISSIFELYKLANK